MLDSFQVDPQWDDKVYIHYDGIWDQYPKIDLREDGDAIFLNKNIDEDYSDELCNYPEHIVDIQIGDIFALPFGEMWDFDGSHESLIVVSTDGEKNGLYDKSWKYIKPDIVPREG